MAKAAEKRKRGKEKLEFVQEYDIVWVEPVSMDSHLRMELRGWYHVKNRFVENEVGQRFYFDFYDIKWLAFTNGPETRYTNGPEAK